MTKTRRRRLMRRWGCWMFLMLLSANAFGSHKFISYTLRIHCKCITMFLLLPSDWLVNSQLGMCLHMPVRGCRVCMYVDYFPFDQNARRAGALVARMHQSRGYSDWYGSRAVYMRAWMCWTHTYIYACILLVYALYNEHNMPDVTQHTLYCVLCHMPQMHENQFSHFTCVTARIVSAAEHDFRSACIYVCIYVCRSTWRCVICV